GLTAFRVACRSRRLCATHPRDFLARPSLRPFLIAVCPKVVADAEELCRFEQTDHAAKPTQRFFIRRFIRKVLDDNKSAPDQTIRCVSYRFVEWMNVMQRSSKHDCIKMALLKIRPCRNARTNPEPP